MLQRWPRRFQDGGIFTWSCRRPKQDRSAWSWGWWCEKARHKYLQMMEGYLSRWWKFLLNKVPLRNDDELILMWPPYFFQYCKALELFRKGASYHVVPSANHFKVFDLTWGLEKLGKYSISLVYLENWRDDLIPIWYRNVFRNRKYTILQNMLKHILYTYWLKSVLKRKTKRTAQLQCRIVDFLDSRWSLLLGRERHKFHGASSFSKSWIMPTARL